METELTKEQRILLTEKVLGECWHEIDKKTCLCTKCGEELSRDHYNTRWLVNKKLPQFEYEYRRTFDDWPDLGALKEKLIEKWWWNEFENFAYDIWDESFDSGDKPSFACWLMEPSRFSILVANFKF